MITLVSRSSKMIVAGVSLIVVITIITMIVWQRSLVVKQEPTTPKAVQDTGGVIPPVVQVDPNRQPEAVVPPVLPAGTNENTQPTPFISPEEALKSRGTEAVIPPVTTAPAPVVAPLTITPSAPAGSTGTTIVIPPAPAVPPTSTEP